jgi:hypothetical protein
MYQNRLNKFWNVKGRPQVDVHLYEEENLYEENRRIVQRQPRYDDQSLQVTWSQILLSAIKVGHASWRDMVRYGFQSYCDILQRATSLYATLQTKESYNRIYFTRTDLFHVSDPSEKNYYSYRIGLAFAGLIAGRHYRVRWPMHLDVYCRDRGVTFRGRSRPDLFGQDDEGQWTIIEAKCRSSETNNKDRIKAKEQSQRVLDIGGVAPRNRAATITWFDSSDFLHVDVIDPPAPSENAIPLTFSLDWFIANYYAPFVRFLIEQSSSAREITILDQKFIVAPIPSSPLEVGLLLTIYHTFSHRFAQFHEALNSIDGAGAIDGLYDQIVDSLTSTHPNPSELDGHTEAAGRDGIVLLMRSS